MKKKSPPVMVDTHRHGVAKGGGRASVVITDELRDQLEPSALRSAMSSGRDCTARRGSPTRANWRRAPLSYLGTSRNANRHASPLAPSPRLGSLLRRGGGPTGSGRANVFTPAGGLTGRPAAASTQIRSDRAGGRTQAPIRGMIRPHLPWKRGAPVARTGVTSGCA